jgi:hypothetical protein
MDLIPAWVLQKCINKYQTDKGCHKYKTYDQLVAFLTAFRSCVHYIYILHIRVVSGFCLYCNIALCNLP